ncbi:MAG: arginase family protein [Vicinamibacterales bacterium]
MHRALTVVGAPSNVGARPYDDGVARDLDLAPAVLRERGVIARLGAVDLGDVAAPRYQDLARPAHRVRNEAQIEAYSRALAERLSLAIGDGQFGVVIGGDCSILLACLLAARRKYGRELGLVYVDAHADFAVDEESPSGAVAGMALALATGRGRSRLARLAGAASLVEGRRAALVGRRGTDGGRGGHAAVAASSILDVPSAQLLADDWLELAALTLDQVASPESRGFWIQLDVDVLNPAVMNAVDSPVPGGPTPRQLERMLAPLVRHPKALGLSVTTYDPALDPDRSCARQLVGFLEALLAPLASR